MKKKILMIIGLITLIFILPNTIFAMDFERDKKRYITRGASDYLNVLTETKRKVCFAFRPDGQLALRDRKTYENILVFKPFTPYPDSTAYSVCKIMARHPNRVFFEVNATDSNGFNIGYWLVGEYKGKWVTFVSTDNLMKMGYDPNKANIIVPNAYNGYYYLRIYDSDAVDAYGDYDEDFLQFTIELDWDDRAQWFSMRKI